jgi:hypothetical protein
LSPKSPALKNSLINQLAVQKPKCRTAVKYQKIQIHDCSNDAKKKKKIGDKIIFQLPKYKETNIQPIYIKQ